MTTTTPDSLQAHRQVGHGKRRYPLCPDCEYNLVATVDAGGRTCPECGEEFDLHDLDWQAGANEWTLREGMMSLAWALARRGAFCGLAWLLLVCGVLMLMDLTGMNSFWVTIGVVAGPAAGWWLGGVMARDCEDIAGCTGLLIPTAAIASIWLTLTVATSIAAIMLSIDGATVGLWVIAGGSLATGNALWLFLSDH